MERAQKTSIKIISYVLSNRFGRSTTQRKTSLYTETKRIETTKRNNKCTRLDNIWMLTQYIPPKVLKTPGHSTF